MSLALDVTVPHPLSASHLHSAATVAEAVASESERKKQLKYGILSGRVLFSPFGIETQGAFGPAARSLVGRLAQRSRDVGARLTRSAISRALLCSVLEGNAACILESYSRATPTADQK